jgi:hypothetical protein
MKFLSVFAIPLLFVLAAGCDGDGDGVGVTTDTTTEETDTTEETKTPVTIDTGSETIEPVDAVTLSDFNIYETGIIEATVEWSSGPSEIDVVLQHDSTVSVSLGDVESPATAVMQATQPLLDNSNGWKLIVYNPSGSEQLTVDYTVRLTPD